MTLTQKGSRWALAFVIFWAADMVIWYIVYGTSNLYHLGPLVPLSWQSATFDSLPFVAGEVAGTAIGLRTKQKREEEQKEPQLNSGLE